MLRQTQHDGIIARTETGHEGTDTRFIATDVAGRFKALYEKVYCRRGAAENCIKAWNTHLAADRTSCTRAVAHPFRLFLRAGAYWLLGACAPPCRSVPIGASPSSTLCGCA